MSRTTIAALQAAAAAFLLVGAVVWMLGLSIGVAAAAGLVSAALGGAVIGASARRAGTAGDDPDRAPPDTPQTTPHDTTETEADRG